MPARIGNQDETTFDGDRIGPTIDLQLLCAGAGTSIDRNEGGTPSYILVSPPLLLLI